MASEVSAFLRRADDAANALLRKIGIKLPKSTAAGDAKRRRSIANLRKLSVQADDFFGDLSVELNEKVIGFARELVTDVARIQDRITDVVTENVPVVDKKVLKTLDDVVDLPIQLYTRLWIETFNIFLESNEKRKKKIADRKGRRN